MGKKACYNKGLYNFGHDKTSYVPTIVDSISQFVKKIKINFSYMTKQLILRQEGVDALWRKTEYAGCKAAA